MVLELVAGRIMAPYLGVSLYTWTSIIGIVLAGISIGNYWGGKIADKNLSLKTLGLVFFLSGAASIGVLYLVPVAGLFLKNSSLPLIVSTFIFSFFTFFPASLFLGCISPMVVKFNLKNLERTGQTVGMIYASGALGSILGTLATGFFLVSLFGTKFIVIGVATVLIFLGFFIASSTFKKKFFKDKINILFSLIFVGSFFLPKNCKEETNYYCISTRPQVSAEGAHGYALKLDHLIHSFVYPSREEILTYDYEKLYKFLTDYFLKKNERDDFAALFLGGGGYTLPRHFEKFYPKSDLEVVEIDPSVTRFNYERLGLDAGTKVKTVNLDARIFLEKLSSDKKYDLVFGDAFNDFAVPYHLTTKEFGEKIRTHLAPGGFYAVNVIDNYKYGRFVSSFTKTLQEIFPNVYLAPLQENWREDRRNTFVILAGDEKIDAEKWEEVLQLYLSAGQYKSMEAVSFLAPEEQVKKFIEEKSAIILTDDYVPTDNLLAPVFQYAY
jgi:spermidine synthase